MKTANIIIKIVAALAAIAGVVYVIATYGDKIVAWAKRLLNRDCCCECDGDCDECECEGDCDECECACECVEEAAEEVAEEAPEAEEADFEK